jgi:hypothetical protein
MKIGLVVLVVFLAAALVLGGGERAWGQQVELQACATIINSLLADWLATRSLYQIGQGHREGNPIIRVTGPDPYFGIIVFKTNAMCRENGQWRLISVLVWIIQTRAVNTHVNHGGWNGPLPLMIFTIP